MVLINSNLNCYVSFARFSDLSLLTFSLSFRLSYVYTL